MLLLPLCIREWIKIKMEHNYSTFIFPRNARNLRQELYEKFVCFWTVILVSIRSVSGFDWIQLQLHTHQSHLVTVWWHEMALFKNSNISFPNTNPICVPIFWSQLPHFPIIPGTLNMPMNFSMKVIENSTLTAKLIRNVLIAEQIINVFLITYLVQQTGFVRAACLR